MRLLLFILLVLFSLLLSAQKYTSVGIANTYTLTTADGFPGSNYVGNFEYTPSGKVYAKDFFGDLHITGNNFIKYVPGTENITNNTMVQTEPHNEVWLVDEKQNITIIKDDSLRKKVSFPGRNPLGVISFMPKKNIVAAIELKNKQLSLYEFLNHDWKKLFEIPFPSDNHYKRIDGYITKEGRFEIAALLHSGNWDIYKMDSANSRLDSLTTVTPNTFHLFTSGLCDSNWKKNNILIKSLFDFAMKRRTYIPTLSLNNFGANLNKFFPIPPHVFSYGNNRYEYLKIDNDQIATKPTVFESKEKLNGIHLNPSYPFLTVLTGNKPFRVFPYIKKYPRIYNNDKGDNIFALAQDDKGRIWAGSYSNQLSIIDDPLHENHSPTIIRLKKQPFPFMNASLNYNGKIYLVGEFSEGGILQFDMDGRMNKLLPQLPQGYYLYLAPKGQIVYYPSAGPGYPVYYCKAEDLGKHLIHWKKLDSTSGIQPFGMTSITEDTLGRIWMGHPKKGFAVYNPETGKGITYTTSVNQTPIGFISSVTDRKGTVWMGSDDHGLWYYNDYSKAPTPENIHQMNHPLVNTVKRITSMAIYNNWLVMGCYDRICLLNLDSFHLKNKIILRYLNPQEAAFTSFTEQNTMLVSKTDSSLWFSTSDMLYRWDIKTWLHLPNYKVNVSTFLQHDSVRLKMNSEKELRLPSSIHGFDITYEYLSPDCLPRFTRTALIRKGDSLTFSEPDFQSHFTYKNLSSGHYTFYLEVFEQDGTKSRYAYSFQINEYLWQHWWFWAALSLLFLMPFVLWFNAHRKKAIQEKELSRMNLVTLSSQFRPHFILNALNSIGADLKDNPGAESIISRLGESINLIFNYAQQRKLSHSLSDEWKLVKNVIDIHRIIYLPELNVKYSGAELLDTYKDFELPLGVLEIHVENALLHGLRNKQFPPYNLKIEIQEDEDNLLFTIADNGIGRKKSMTISSYKKNGVGTKNLNNIIATLNRFNKNQIQINYEDITGKEGSGTIVKIKVPKKFHYKY